jgi:ketosteroid isomerase-like protein
MKNLILTSTLLIVLALATFGGAPAQQPGIGTATDGAGLSADQQALVDDEKAWAKAITARDIKTLDRLMADDFVDTGSLGSMSSKADILQSIQSTSTPPHRNQLQDLKVRVYGDAAVVKGLNVVMDQEGNFLRRVRFTDTFVRRAGEWKAVAGHECVVVVP